MTEVSGKPEIVLVRVPRTGSSAMKEWLQLPTESADHKTAAQYMKEMGEERWQKAVTIGGVRHPYSQITSWWKFHRIRLNMLCYRSSLTDWVQAGCSTHWKEGSPDPFDQVEFLKHPDREPDRPGWMAVSRPYTYPDTYADLVAQLRADLNPGTHLPVVSWSPRADSCRLSRSDRDVIYGKYRRCFDVLGFSRTIS